MCETTVVKRSYIGGRAKEGGVGYAGSGGVCLVFGYLQISLANHKPRLAVGKSLSLHAGRVKRQSNIDLLHTRTAGE